MLHDPVSERKCERLRLPTRNRQGAFHGVHYHSYVGKYAEAHFGGFFFARSSIAERKIWRATGPIPESLFGTFVQWSNYGIEVNHCLQTHCFKKD